MDRSQSRYFHTAVKMDMALIELLEEKPFGYITVSDVCRKAGVNRSTFYLHYENTGELLEEATRYLLDSFLTCFPDEKGRITDRFSACPLPELNYISEEYLCPYLAYIRENRRVFATALAHGEALGFGDIYQRMYRYIFDPILARFHYPDREREYVMLFYLRGIHAIVGKWLQEDCDRPVEEIAAVIQTCIFGRDGGADREILL